MILIILLACWTVDRWGASAETALGKRLGNCRRRGLVKIELRFQPAVSTGTPPSSSMRGGWNITPKLHHRCFPNRLIIHLQSGGPWTWTCCTWCVQCLHIPPFFLGVCVHCCTKAMYVPENVKAIFHLCWHKCHKAAEWQRKGAFLFLLRWL